MSSTTKHPGHDGQTDASDDPLDMLEPPPDSMRPVALAAALPEHDISLDTPPPATVGEDGPGDGDDYLAGLKPEPTVEPVANESSGKTPVVSLLSRGDEVRVTRFPASAPHGTLDEEHGATSLPHPLPPAPVRMPTPAPLATVRAPSAPHGVPIQGGLPAARQFPGSGSVNLRAPTPAPLPAAAAPEMPAPAPVAAAPARLAAEPPSSRARLSISVLGFSLSLFAVYLGGIATAILITHLNPTAAGTTIAVPIATPIAPSATAAAPAPAGQAPRPMAAPLPAAAPSRAPTRAAAPPATRPAPAPVAAAPEEQPAPKPAKKAKAAPSDDPFGGDSAPAAAPSSAPSEPAAPKPKKPKKQTGWPDPFG